MAGELHFYDSANPANVPSGVAAAVYVNGAYRWPAAQVNRMSRVFRISVEAEASWARISRCIDIENGAGTPPEAVAFVEARRHYGYDDATVYVNRGNWGAVRTEFNTHKIAEPLYWVATLDGTTIVPGAWAVQYQGGFHAPYDVSVLHGVDNLHAP